MECLIPIPHTIYYNKAERERCDGPLAICPRSESRIAEKKLNVRATLGT